MDLLLQDMLSQIPTRPQGGPLLLEKSRCDPCGEGRVPQLGLLRRKHNLPHQVGKPAQSPILVCQVRLSNIKNKEFQASGGLKKGSPPVARKRPLLGPPGKLTEHNLPNLQLSLQGPKQPVSPLNCGKRSNTHGCVL